MSQTIEQQELILTAFFNEWQHRDIQDAILQDASDDTLSSILIFSGSIHAAILAEYDRRGPKYRTTIDGITHRLIREEDHPYIGWRCDGCTWVASKEARNLGTAWTEYHNTLS